MRHGAGSVIGAVIIFIVTNLAAAEAPPIPGYVAVPLSRAGNHLVIVAAVNGYEMPLLLDTGAPFATLSESAAARVAASQNSQERKYNVNGQHAKIARVQSLRVGGMDFGACEVVVTDLSMVRSEQYLSGHEHRSVEGIFGADLLIKHGAIIDGSRQVIYFNNDPARRARLGPLLAQSGWTPVPMTRTNQRHFSVPTQVNGKDFQLIVDTGAFVTTVAAQRLEALGIYGKEAAVNMGFLNSEAMLAKTLALKDWRIGEFAIKSFPVGVTKLPINMINDRAPAGGPTLGLLGNETLLIYHAIIDCGGMKLFLHPY